MKNNYLYNWVVIVFMMLQMLAFTSCSDDDDNSGWPTETDKTEIFIERFSTLVTNLTALRDGATYGELKDNYPVSSKAMLDDEIVYLEETIAKLKEGNKKLADSEADRIIREANQIEKNFRATRRTEDFLPISAELLVNGKNGGYIDFGVHPEYSAFGEQGQQAFTVEFWVKLTDVTNENGADGEVRDGIPVMTKIYVNGQLMLSERGRDDRLPYTSNDKEVAMVAFTGLSATANRIGEKSTNGCMRHLHIWKSAKTQAEIQHLMDTPESVTGSESDLVCGWTLNKTVSDNNNIKDLTGKFSARLIGDFQWVENR